MIGVNKRHWARRWWYVLVVLGWAWVLAGGAPTATSIPTAMSSAGSTSAQIDVVSAASFSDPGPGKTRDLGGERGPGANGADRTGGSADELVEMVLSDLSAKAYAGAAVLPLVVPNGSPPLWAVHSYGRRNFELRPVPGHFVALYTYDGGWRELTRLDVDAPRIDVRPQDAVAPDYLAQDSVTQVDLDPDFIWLEVRGGAGAHSGTYQLLRYDGRALQVEVAAFGPTREIGHLRDLNGDGLPEVLLDRSDPYLFCSACGVREAAFEVQTWERSELRMRSVELEPISPGEPDHPAVQTANRAIELARAGLWVDARTEIGLALALAAESGVPDDPAALEWSAALIELHAGALADEATQSPYPLLGHLFYGDYGAALDLMRAYESADLLRIDSPLIAGTVAEGWEQELIDLIVEHSTAALAVAPERTEAYWLRGWARYLRDRDDPLAQADLVCAALLDPEEPLFVLADALAAE